MRSNFAYTWARGSLPQPLKEGLVSPANQCKFTWFDTFTEVHHHSLPLGRGTGSRNFDIFNASLCKVAISTGSVCAFSNPAMRGGASCGDDARDE